MTDPASILVVEDNPGDALLIETMLVSGFSDACEIRSVTSLAAARESLAAAQPDVVLLDLSLPDSAGLETLDGALGDTGDPPPIIVITGGFDAAKGLEAVRRGAQDYVQKNEMRPETLTRTIKFAIERHRLAALRQLGAGAEDAPDPEGTAAPSLKNLRPQVFDTLVDQYRQCLQEARQRAGQQPQEFPLLVQRLGFVRATQADARLIHAKVLQQAASASPDYSIPEEMLGALLGAMADYYRQHAVPERRKDQGERQMP